MKITYYIFCIQWLWKNRLWNDSRQKFRAMNKAWECRKARKRYKTRQDRFLKRYPNAALRNDVLQICPEEVYGAGRIISCENVSCTECKKEFWTKKN